MESTTQPNSSHTLSTSQETWRMECEAKHYIGMFNEIKAIKGLEAACGWWGNTISSIENKRGKDSAEQLRNKMNELRR